MNKPDLIDKCTYRLGRLPRREVEVSCDAILELMKQSLEKGERIEVRGFGSFSLKKMKARMSRNPKTGKPVHLNERAKIHFKPGKEMRERVNADWDMTNGKLLE